MTSLARQLQQLAVPHTQSILSDDRRKASLLFDQKEAANIDRHTLLSLGLSGLEELEGIDPAFAEVEANLFHQSSENWERSLQTKEVNKQLDDTIEEFLIRLSPYFLLKASHKALEWLIHRYHIHYYNVDAILMCLLPYHDTKVCIHMLQLLPLENPSGRWHWLYPAVNGGVSIARSTIVTHFIKDASFQSFLCDMVSKFIKVHGVGSSQLRPVLSLYTCIMLGALSDAALITDGLVAILVPSIIQGLKSKCLEYKAATYMIISQLVSQTKVQENFLMSIMPVLSKHMIPQLCKEACLCFILICQTHNISQFPKRCMRHFCRMAGLAPLLGSLGSIYQVEPFLQVFLPQLVPQAIRCASGGGTSGTDSGGETGSEPSTYGGLLQAILKDVQLEAQLATLVARTLLLELVAIKQNKNVGGHVNWKEVATNYLGLIDSRYSASMDAAISHLLTSVTGDEYAALQDVLNVISSGIKYLPVTDDGTTSLLLGLSHPQPSLRVMALQRLASCIENKQKPDEGFICDVLLARLSDDQPEVLDALMDMRQHLLTFIPKPVLFERVLKMVKAMLGNSSWSSVLQRMVEFLSSREMADSVPDTPGRLMPLCLVTEDEETQLCVAYTVIKPTYTHKEWLATYKKLEQCNRESRPTLLKKLNSCFITGIYTPMIDMDMENLKLLLEKMAADGEKDGKTLLLTLSCMKKLLDLECDAERSVHISHVVLNISSSLARNKTRLDRKWKKSLTEARTFEDKLAMWIKTLHKHGTIQQGALLHALEGVVNTVKRIQKDMTEDDWPVVTDDTVRVITMLLHTLMTHACDKDLSSKVASPWQQLIIKLTQEVLTVHRYVPVVCGIIASGLDPEDESISPLLQVGSLHLLARAWEGHAQVMVKQLTPASPVLAMLLSCLSQPYVSLRQAALNCFITAKNHWGKHNKALLPVVKKICKYQEEVLADPHHISYLVSSLASKEDGIGKKQQSLSALKHILGCLDTCPLSIQQALLHCLKDTPSLMLMDHLVPCGEKVLKVLIKHQQNVTLLHLTVLEEILSHIDEEVAPNLELTSDTGKFFIAALQCEYQPRHDISAPQVLAMNQISKVFFHSLPTLHSQQGIVSAILNVAERTTYPDVANTVHRTLKQIKLCGKHISHELNYGKEANSVKARRKSKALPLVSRGPSWKRITVLLEALQSRKHVDDSEYFVTLLFSLLKQLATAPEEDAEYRRRLILACLHSITSRWRQESITPKQENLNLEVLVQCVRDSDSPQCQQQALLVMAAVANFFPDYILHNVMSIFTFVGGGLLQQDDSHSFQVITHTIETLIPALLKAQEESASSATQLEGLISSILQVFIDAHHAVPRHRCLLVFQTLLNTLGAHQYLWMVMVLLVESAVRNKAVVVHAPEEGDHGDSIAADLEFAVSIIEQFHAANQLEAVTHTLQFLHRFTDVHLQSLQSAGGTGVHLKKPRQISGVPCINTATLTPQQMRLYQFHLTKLISALLTNKNFVKEVVGGQSSGDLEDKVKDVACEPADFQRVIKEALMYITKLTSASGSQSNKSTAKFWKALLSKAYDIIDKVNYLLPNEILFEVVSSLVLHDMVSVRRKALDLLGSKLQQLQPSSLTATEVSGLLTLVDILENQARDDRMKVESDVLACCQMSLFSLKLLCRLLGASHPKPFTKLFVLVIGLMKAEDVPTPVVSSNLLCLAELVSTLMARAIPHLNTFMPPLISILRDSPALAKNELLLMCGCTALQRIVSSLPHFLSPYLHDLLLVICELGVLVEGESGSKTNSQSNARLAAVRHQMATVIAPRVLVPALTKCFDRLLETNQLALKSVMAMVKEHVETMTLEDLTAQHTPLLNLFLQMLDIRNASLKLTEEETSGVEDSVIEALLAMVVRLSETSFRPMFFKLYDWACQEDSTEYKNRKLTFFKLADRLAAKLKSLFNLFVKHILQAACKILEQNNTLHGDVTYFGEGPKATGKCCRLLGYILDCLQKCMLYDSDRLFQKEVFSMIMKPVVDQIENEVGGDAVYEKRIMDHVAPCLAQFSLASKEDSAWKSLNYQILLKTRHSSPKVRFAALQVVEGMAQKLGEEYMALLPETIPFLAELMEDEVEEVEEKCQQVISSLEEILGESLQKYF